MLIVVLFIVFNVNNSSDISFGFKTYEEVPIFLSLFIAFAAGALVTIPMVLFGKRKKNPEKEVKKEVRKEVGKKRKSGKKGASSGAAENGEEPGENETF
jgi:uncharacterized integral membrane protein